jgi:hypothetical protein
VTVLITGAERRRATEAARSALFPLARLGDTIIRTAVIMRDKQLQQQIHVVRGAWRSRSLEVSRAIQYAAPHVDPDVHDALRRLEERVSKIADDVARYSVGRLDRDIALALFEMGDIGAAVYGSAFLEFDGAE